MDSNSNLYRGVGAHLQTLLMIPLPGRAGPYPEAELLALEATLGQALEPCHRFILRTMGGPFTFEFGAVDVGSFQLNVAALLSAHGDYDIGDVWTGYSDEIPGAWYPFAKDHDGDLYCLTDMRQVYHVPLAEPVKKRRSRPVSAGRLVSPSFIAFILGLRLPSWVPATLPRA